MKRVFIWLVVVILVHCRYKESGKIPEQENSLEYIARNPFRDSSTYPRIYVDANENITVNGKPSTINYVDSLLQEVYRKHGFVFYSTPGATANPPREGIVIDLIKKYEIAIGMYSDSTFSQSLH